MCRGGGTFGVVDTRKAKGQSRRTLGRLAHKRLRQNLARADRLQLRVGDMRARPERCCARPIPDGAGG